MSIEIRQLLPSDKGILEEVTRLMMAMVLETCPEFEGSAEKAQKALSNFTFESMFSMLTMSVPLVDEHRHWIAIEDDVLAGYWIASVKTDMTGQQYGYLFSVGLKPEYRRRGLGLRFWQTCTEWWKDFELDYLRAETHADNLPAQAFFAKLGYEQGEVQYGKWRYVVLHHPRTSAKEVLSSS
jgi:ribosomal protein S18 acetylase RimI-like enzyme